MPRRRHGVSRGTHPPSAATAADRKFIVKPTQHVNRDVHLRRQRRRAPALSLCPTAPQRHKPYTSPGWNEATPPLLSGATCSGRHYAQVPAAALAAAAAGAGAGAGAGAVAGAGEGAGERAGAEPGSVDSASEAGLEEPPGLLEVSAAGWGAGDPSGEELQSAGAGAGAVTASGQSSSEVPLPLEMPRFRRASRLLQLMVRGSRYSIVFRNCFPVTTEEARRPSDLSRRTPEGSCDTNAGARYKRSMDSATQHPIGMF